MCSLHKLFALVVLLVLPACRDFGPEPTGPYDYMFLDRNGGGDLGFKVIPISTPDSVQVVVTHREFRDTTVEMVLVRSDTTAKPFDSLFSALRGEARITGDFRQSTLPTGTWVRVYVVQAESKWQVTNVDLRNTLLEFEEIVRNNLGPFQPLAP